MGIYAIALVAWLMAAAAGSQPYSVVQNFIQSLFGQILFVGGIFCFFLHLCGGIRHLLWDTGRGFELRAIYASGWMVVAASTVLTVAAWIMGAILTR